ncbi:MAG: DUF2164 domain-containing protein [Thiolinea sp.]
MSEIKFSKEEKAVLVQKIKLYFAEELDQKIGQFDAEFLIDFIGEEMGTYYYNRGIQDAQLALNHKIEEISDALYDLEKPVTFHKT